MELHITAKYERAQCSRILLKVLNMLPVDETYQRVARVGVIAWDPVRHRVLLIQGHGSVWGIPKGGTELGETLHQTAKREMREETGIDLSLRELYGCVRIPLLVGKKSRVPHYFFVWITQAPPDAQAELHIQHNEEIQRAVWVGYARLKYLANQQDGAHTILRHLCSWLDVD